MDLNCILKRTYDDGYKKGADDAITALAGITTQTARILAACAAPKNEVEIVRVVFNEPATIVFWGDKTKTVVKTQDGEAYDPEKGLAMAIVKKICGNNGAYYEIFKEFCPQENDAPAETETPETPGE